MSKWFAFFMWEEWVICFKRAAEIHGKHREPLSIWGFPYTFAKDSCRMHVLVIAALWNRITLNLGQTFYSDWNPTTQAIFLLKGIFMCTIFTSPNIYLHIQKQKEKSQSIHLWITFFRATLCKTGSLDISYI